MSESRKVAVEYALTVSVEDASTQLKELERLMFRTLNLMRQLGLPPEADAAIRKMQHVITTIRMLQISLNLLEAASGPIGWALFAVSAVSTALTVGNTMYDSMGGY